MNPFGSYNPANYSQNNPLGVDTGLPWAYIRVINNSPYMLSVTFGGMGSVVFPEMFLEDIPITSSYNGKISIVPFANFPPGSIAAALSTLVSINAYQPGELRQPQAQPLTTLAAVGNPVPIGTAATNIINDGNPTGTEIVEASVGGIQHVLMFNDGNLALQKDATSADQEMFDLVDLAVGGHIWGLFLATGATHGLYFLDENSSKVALGLLASGGIQHDSGIVQTDGAGHETNTATAGAGANSLLAWAPSDDASLQVSWRATGTEFVLHDDALNARIASFFMGQGGIRISGLGSRMVAWSFFSGTGSGTFSHGLGTTPTVVLAMQNTVGSQTMGWDSANSTTVHITAGNGAAWTALALDMA